MTSLNRRRFLAISASALALAGPGHSGSLRQWSGSGLGAHMTITLDHADGEAIAERAFAEVDRLEDIFSLYRPASALSRLNAEGALENPPFELLECLGICGGVQRASGGAFDPTVQPLWRLYAEAFSNGRAPGTAEIRETLAMTGWNRVAIDPAAIRLDQGMALTLNGVAQGYVADRVAALLRAEGLDHVLIDTGEISALGGDWPVSLIAGNRLGEVPLRDRALASSAPLGTVFDTEGTVGHILDPVTGLPAAPVWRLVSVTAPGAALADALSTAAVLMKKSAIDAMLARYPRARLALAHPVA